MKKYVIREVPNEFVRSVSVCVEYVDEVIQRLIALPYVDSAERFPGRKTQIQVVLSEAVEDSDLKRWKKSYGG